MLSDQGICCIDEFDKMSEATRAILHEVGDLSGGLCGLVGFMRGDLGG